MANPNVDIRIDTRPRGSSGILTRMRRVTYSALAAAFVAVAGAGPAPSAEPVARVAVMDRAPLTVGGVGFAADERVTVRVAPIGGTAFSKLVTTRSTGRFTAVFRTRSLAACLGYTITARGSRGALAVARELVPPACGIQTTE